MTVAADMTGFDATVTKEAGKTGDKAGTTLGQRMSKGMGTAVRAGLVGLGTAGGALFGLASKGASELTAAVTDYTAATGATAAEAEVAQASIAKLYKNNLNGFAE